MNHRNRYHRFRIGRPGQRFRNHYRESQHRQRGRTRRLLQLLAGGVIMLAGAVMLVTPGPGLLALLLGSALMAEESLLVAKALDKLELLARESAGWLTGRWRRWRSWRRS